MDGGRTQQTAEAESLIVGRGGEPQVRRSSKPLICCPTAWESGRSLEACPSGFSQIHPGSAFGARTGSGVSRTSEW